MSGWLNDKNLNLNKRIAMKKYTLEQCLDQQKKVDAGIKHNGEYMPWLAGIKEVIEMCDHLSMIDTWKKQAEPDMKQAFMELVDVFAFAMSEKKSYHNIIDEEIEDALDYSKSLGNKSTLAMIISSFLGGGFNSCMGSLIAFCENYFNRDPDDIFYYYMGKQTLTQFRQNNGYKDGTYQKVWGGREDNEFLTDALEQGIDIDDIPEYLETAYNAAIKGV